MIQLDAGDSFAAGFLNALLDGNGCAKRCAERGKSVDGAQMAGSSISEAILAWLEWWTLRTLNERNDDDGVKRVYGIIQHEIIGAHTMIVPI